LSVNIIPGLWCRRLKAGVYALLKGKPRMVEVHVYDSFVFSVGDALRKPTTAKVAEEGHERGVRGLVKP
jgi:hypothetical protein